LARGDEHKWARQEGGGEPGELRVRQTDHGSAEPLIVIAVGSLGRERCSDSMIIRPRTGLTPS
jgi:hypothetical protein